MKVIYPSGKRDGPKVTSKFICSECRWREKEWDDGTGYSHYECCEPSFEKPRNMGGATETPDWCPKLKDAMRGASQQLLFLCGEGGVVK